LKWAEKAYAKLEPRRVQGGHFSPIKRSLALAVSIVVLLRSLGGTPCTLGPVVGNAGVCVFPADAPTLGLSHAQLGAALVNLDGAYANVYGRAASRKITSYMDCGFYWRSKRIYFDLGGGGSSRNGYNGAQVWPILKQLGNTDPHAQELVDFHERLRAHLSERLKFEVKVGSSMAINTSHRGDTALHCDGKSFMLRTVTTLMADENAGKRVSVGLVYDDRSSSSREGKGCGNAAWDFVCDIEVGHGQTYCGDEVALGARAVGPGLAMAHRVNPLDGDQWVLVIDWILAA
jgi:hypothetical protein